MSDGRRTSLFSLCSPSSFSSHYPPLCHTHLLPVCVSRVCLLSFPPSPHLLFLFPLCLAAAAATAGNRGPLSREGGGGGKIRLSLTALFMTESQLRPGKLRKERGRKHFLPPFLPRHCAPVHLLDQAIMNVFCGRMNVRTVGYRVSDPLCRASQPTPGGRRQVL